MHDNANKPLRVAQILGKMKSGGVESVVLNYYRHIDRSQVQFDFIIDRDSTAVPTSEIEALGGRIFEIPPYQKPFSYHIALARLLRREKYSIVHSHINALSAFPLFAAKSAGVPIRIAHSHTTSGKDQRIKHLLKNALRPLSRVFPTHYFACSEYAGRWLFGDRQFEAGNVVLLKNAIDTSLFTFDPAACEAVREELGLGDKLVIGHVGRFVRVKNHAFIIEIFRQIHNMRPDSVLLLVGEGELEKESRGQVNRLGLESSVLFLGLRDDVHRLLQGFDVFLLPSLYEGLPVVTVEAQACGVKCVVSDNVTAEAKITDSMSFFSLKSSPKEWAEQALAQASRANRQDASNQAALAGYDIRREAARLLELYRSMEPMASKRETV
jgi:glycosyltransferase EpsF